MLNLFLKMHKKKIIIVGIIVLIIIIGDISFSQYQKFYGKNLTVDEMKNNIEYYMKNNNYEKAEKFAVYYYGDSEMVRSDIKIAKENNFTSYSEIDKYEKQQNIKEKIEELQVEKNKAIETSQTAKSECINNFMTYYFNNEDSLTDDQKEKILDGILTLKSEFKKQNYLNSFTMSDYNTWNINYIEPQINMTKYEVYAFTRYTNPRDINKTTTKSSIYEQYCYSGNIYLYFDNDVLTSIQN